MRRLTPAETEEAVIQHEDVATETLQQHISDLIAQRKKICDANYDDKSESEFRDANAACAKLSHEIDCLAAAISSRRFKAPPSPPTLREEKVSKLTRLKTMLYNKRRAVELIEYEMRKLMGDIADLDMLPQWDNPDREIEPETIKEPVIMPEVFFDEPKEKSESNADSQKRIFEWILTPQIRRGANKVIGKRAIAIGWILFPEIFNGASITSIAKAIGTTPAALAGLTGDASRSLNVRSHSQSHAANFKNN